MLKFFTRMERTRKYVIAFFAFLMVLGMVVAGVYNRSGAVNANPFKSREVIAKVGSDEVTVADYSLLKKKMESQFGGNFSLAQLGMTGERILDQAINSRIALQEARRLGLTASDAEVRDLIAKQFSDPSTGFDYKRYSDYVVRSYGSVPLYEQSVRDALAAQKLRSYVTAGVQVSEAEVKDDFMRDNTAFDVTYVPVNAQDLAEKLAPSDDEMRQYFDAHQTDYRLLEPQKKIRYLFVSQDKVGQKLSISDEDLHKEYDSLKPENKMAGVRVQQIVLRVARPELDQEILAKATGLVTKIRGEDLTATEEAFADLARGNSEDPSTAKGGGWLPNPVKKNPNRKTNAGAPGNAAELAQNTLEWKEGQVGDPLKTGNAYYVFRRGPVVPKTFEDAKQELLVSLRNRRSYAAAQAVAQKAQERLRESHDVAKTAQEFAAEANMSPAEMTKETGFVRPGDDVPDIGSSPQFEDAIKPLEEPNQVGDRVGVKNGFAIPMLAEKRDPRVPEFDEVRDRVATDLKRARAGEQLEQTARDLATNSASPDALKAAAGKLGLKPQDEEGFHLGRPLGTAGADPAIDSAVYALKVGETTKTPVKVGETWVVLGVTKRDDAKTEDFDKRKSQLVETAINERREQVFDEFLTSARRRLEEKGDIQINRDTLAQLEEAEAPPTAVPPRAPITIPPQGK